MKFSYEVGGAEQPPEPLQIEITGTDSQGNAIEPRTFNCKPERGDAALLTYLGDVERASQTRKGVMMATADMITFLADSIFDDERASFLAMLEDDNVRVKTDLLTRIFFDLAGVYANRPTKRSEPSSTGSSPTSDISPAASPSPKSQSFVIPPLDSSAMSPTA